MTLTLTPAQVREARHLLGMTQEVLARLTGLSSWHIQVFEAGTPRHKYGFYEWEDRIVVIRAALEAAGVSFTHGEDPGVKLRKGTTQ